MTTQSLDPSERLINAQRESRTELNAMFDLLIQYERPVNCIELSWVIYMAFSSIEITDKYISPKCALCNAFCAPYTESLIQRTDRRTIAESMLSTGVTPIGTTFFTEINTSPPPGMCEVFLTLTYTLRFYNYMH